MGSRQSSRQPSRPTSRMDSLPALARRPVSVSFRTTPARPSASRSSQLKSSTFLGEGEFARTLKADLALRDRDSVRAAFKKWFPADCKSTPDLVSDLGDLKQVERDLLPVGVPDSFAERMRYDASLSPVLHGLRMNRQNFLKECFLHGGIVANQGALMQPVVSKRNHPKPRLSQTQVPYGVADSLKKRAIRVNKLKEKEERRKALEESLADDSMDPLPKPVTLADIARLQKPTMPIPMKLSATAMSEDIGENPDDKPQPGPHRLEDRAIWEKMQDEKVREVYDSLRDEGAALRGMPVARANRGLELLGFDDPDPQLLKSCLPKPEDVAHLGLGSTHMFLEHFAKMVLEFSRKRRVELLKRFEQVDTDGSGTVGVFELKKVIWDFGYTVSEESIAEILAEVATDGSTEVGLPQFEELMDNVYKNMGFTKGEVANLFYIFDQFDDAGSGEMSPVELSGAMGYFGTACSLGKAKEIITEFDDDGSGTLSKFEFIKVMRARLEEEIDGLRSMFSEFDVDNSGSMDMSEITNLFEGCGFTMSKAVIQESMGQMSNNAKIQDTQLRFEDVIRLLHIVRKSEGFASVEVKELMDAFKQLGKHKEQLREFEVLHVARGLGFALSQSRLRLLWCAVDINKSETINDTEFLKLMRMLREIEVKEVCNLLSEAIKENRVITGTQFKTILNKMGYSPSHEVLKRAFKTAFGSLHHEDVDVKRPSLHTNLLDQELVPEMMDEDYSDMKNEQDKEDLESLEFKPADVTVTMFLDVFAMVREVRQEEYRTNGGLPPPLARKIRQKVSVALRKQDSDEQLLQRSREQVSEMHVDVDRGIDFANLTRIIFEARGEDRSDEAQQKIVERCATSCKDVHAVDAQYTPDTAVQVTMQYLLAMAEEDWLRERNRNHFLTKYEIIACRDAFHRADQDEDGILSLEEVAEGLITEDIPITTRQLQMLRKELLVAAFERSESITFDVFMIAMKKVMGIDELTRVEEASPSKERPARSNSGDVDQQSRSSLSSPDSRPPTMPTTPSLQRAVELVPGL